MSYPRLEVDITKLCYNADTVLGWCKEHNITIDELQKKGASVGVMWQDGRRFFEPYGIRMNLALPFSRVKEAFDRLDLYVFTD